MPMASPSSPSVLRRVWLGAEYRTLRYLFRRTRRRSKLPPHLLLGMQGEFEAFFYLRRLGYTVVARRWRSAKLRGDLDLIAWDGSTLCFIEVKTRSRRGAIAAEAAVDRDKQQMLQTLARAYIRRLPSEPPQARFDVLSLYLDESDAFRGSSHPAEHQSFVLYKGAISWK
jgi:putative endonuclease